MCECSGVNFRPVFEQDFCVSVTRYECSGVNLRPLFEQDFCVSLLSETEAVRLQQLTESCRILRNCTGHD